MFPIIKLCKHIYQVGSDLLNSISLNNVRLKKIEKIKKIESFDLNQQVAIK